MRWVWLTCLVACEYNSPPSSTTADGPPTPEDTGDGPTVEEDGPTIPPDGNGVIVIEAEATTTSTSADGVHTWTVQTTLPGFAGTGYVTALPDDNGNCVVITDTNCGAFATYDATATIAGTYRVVIRHHSLDGSNDSIHWYVGALAHTETFPLTTEWVDDISSQTVTLPVGAFTFSMRMRENDAKIDQIRLELE